MSSIIARQGDGSSEDKGRQDKGTVQDTGTVQRHGDGSSVLKLFSFCDTFLLEVVLCPDYQGLKAKPESITLCLEV